MVIGSEEDLEQLLRELLEEPGARVFFVGDLRARKRKRRRGDGK
jgi:hypothetical protein